MLEEFTHFFQEQNNENRSNSVYVDNDKTKINDFKYKKLYFGSPTKYNSPMKLTGPLFVTPFRQIACIFAVRPQNLQQFGVPKGIGCNRSYDEWEPNKTDAELAGLLRDLHVHLIPDGECEIKESVSVETGFIHTIEVNDIIKDHIYQSSKMNQRLEFCIDKLTNIKISETTPVKIKVHVDDGRKSNQIQEQYSLFELHEGIFMETYKPYDEYLKKHKYDEKTNTIEVNGVRVNAGKKGSNKERNRLNRFLRENNFNPKDETIETDIMKNGKKKRIKFDPNGKRDQFITTLAPGVSKDDIDKKVNNHIESKNDVFDRSKDPKIRLTKKTMMKKPRIATAVFKHEEGHAALYYDDKEGKYVCKLKEIADIIDKSEDIYKGLNEHDMKVDEIFADHYSKTHNRYNKISKDKGKAQMKLFVDDLKTISIDVNSFADLISRVQDDEKRGFKAVGIESNNQSKRINANIEKGIPYTSELIKSLSKFRSKVNRMKSKIFNLELAVERAEEYDKYFIERIDEIRNRLFKYNDQLSHAEIQLMKWTNKYETLLSDIESNNEMILKLNNKMVKVDEARHYIFKRMKDIDDKFIFTFKKMDDKCKKTYEYLKDEDSKLYNEFRLYEDKISIIEKSLKSKQYNLSNFKEYKKTHQEMVDDYKSLISIINKDLEETKQNRFYNRKNMMQLKSELTKLKRLYNNLSESLKTFEETVDKLSDDKSVMDNIRNEVIDEINKLNKSTFLRLFLNLPEDEREYVFSLIKEEQSKQIQEQYMVQEMDTPGINCYRYTYNDIGIYEAFKNEVSFEVWKNFITSDAATWLPKPPKYGENDRSYFTEIGCSMFEEKTLPFMKTYLEPAYIKKEQISISNEIYAKAVYEDEYQIVLPDISTEVINETKLSTSKRNKLSDDDFGIPETRSFPIHDKQHVIQAVRMFGNAPMKYKKSLAHRILNRAKEFNMDTSKWESLNKFIDN